MSAGSGVHSPYGTGLVCWKLLLRACLCLVLLQMDTPPYLGWGAVLQRDSGYSLILGLGEESAFVNVCKRMGVTSELLDVCT